MPWVSMSDDVSDHRKVIKAGLLAELLWRRSIEWSNRNLTDGFIPAGKVRTLADFHGIYEEVSEGRLMATPEPVEAMRLVERLLREGLWERADGGFQVHDYLKHQPSAKDVRRQRRIARQQRASAGKNGAEKRWSRETPLESPTTTG